MYPLIFHANNAARIAVEVGAAGIIVSNHGARQLDYVPATIVALEEVQFSKVAITLLYPNHFWYFLITLKKTTCT